MIKIKRAYVDCISALDALDDISKVVDTLNYSGAALEEEATIVDEKVAEVSNFLKALKESIETEMLKDTYEIDSFEPIHE